MSRIVLKLGGRVATEAAAEALALRGAGHDVVVVHGAGPQITAEMERRGIVPTFVNGRRFTTAEILGVVRGSLAAVNAEVCAAIGPARAALRRRDRAPGDPGRRARARRAPDSVRAGRHRAGARRRRIAVVAPLAAGLGDIGALNVNADEAAAALAVGLAAERIVFFTDVPGVLMEGAVIEHIAVDDADRMLGDGTFEGGIVPKLEAAVRAARGGVRAEIGATEVVA